MKFFVTPTTKNFSIKKRIQKKKLIFFLYFFLFLTKYTFFFLLIKKTIISFIVLFFYKMDKYFNWFSRFRSLNFNEISDIDNLYIPIEQDIHIKITNKNIHLISYLYDISKHVKSLSICSEYNDNLLYLPQLLSPIVLSFHNNTLLRNDRLNIEKHDKLYKMLPQFKKLMALEILMTKDVCYSIVDFLLEKDNHNILDHITTIIIDGTIVPDPDIEYSDDEDMFEQRNLIAYTNNDIKIRNLLTIVQTKTNINTIILKSMVLGPILANIIINNKNLKHIIINNCVIREKESTFSQWLLYELETLCLVNTLSPSINMNKTTSNLRILKTRFQLSTEIYTSQCFRNLLSLQITHHINLSVLHSIVRNIRSIQELDVSLSFYDKPTYQDIYNLIDLLHDLKHLDFNSNIKHQDQHEFENLITRYPNLQNITMGSPSLPYYKKYVNINNRQVPPNVVYNGTSKCLAISNVGNSPKIVVDTIEYFSHRTTKYMTLCFDLSDYYIYSAKIIDDIVKEIDSRPLLNLHKFGIEIVKMHNTELTCI